MAADIGAGLIGGYVGTRVMEPVSEKLYELESEADRKREDEIRPGSPYTIAARKAARLVGVTLSDERAERLGMLFHYGLGAGGGALYAVLRRTTRMHPLGAGLVTGAAISLIFDEGLTRARVQRAERSISDGHARPRVRRTSGVRPEPRRRCGGRYIGAAVGRPTVTDERASTEVGRTGTHQRGWQVLGWPDAGRSGARDQPTRRRMTPVKWNFDPAHTTVDVSAKHMMITTVRGRFSGLTGEIDYDPKDPLRATAWMEIPAKSVDTGDDKRDTHLRSPDFLDSDRYPKIRFESRSIKRDERHFLVTGELTIRGTTNPVTATVEVSDVMDDP